MTCCIAGTWFHIMITSDVTAVADHDNCCNVCCSIYSWETAALLAILCCKRVQNYITTVPLSWIVLINRDGQYNTTIINTDTSSCSIDTWFLTIPIWYLTHMVYFGVPGTCGTSVLSERLFSKSGELHVVAATRSNIKPKNVDMILFLNKKT